MDTRLALSNGGSNAPCTQDGLFRFVPPEEFSARTAVALGGARDDSVFGPRKIILKLRVNWGYASARQLKRV